MVYWIFLYLFRFIMKTYFRGKVYGVGNFPQSGPYVGAINHRSYLDTAAVTLALNQRTHTMIKASLFKIPILKWWLKAVDMFPVERDASDIRAFSHSVEVLKKGEILFMAPEGTRKRRAGERPRPRIGFVRMAQLAGCPVVPMAIWGTDRALPPGARFPKPVRIMVKVGKPIYLEKIEVKSENKDKLQRQADMVMDVIYQMRRELKELDRKLR